MYQRIVRVIMTVVLLTLFFVAFDISRLSANEQYASVQQDETDEADDLGVVDSTVATISIPNLPLGVYPKRPTGDVEARNPFYHEQYPAVELVSESFYDPDVRRLQFDIRLTDIPADLQIQARQMAATAVGDAGQANNVVLLPLPLQAYEIYLRQGDLALLVASGQADQGPFSGVLPVNTIIEDETFHRALAQDPGSLRVAFRPFYRFKVFDVNTALVVLSQRIASETIESVLGEAASSSNFVTRDVLNQVQSLAESKLRVELPAGASGEIFDVIETVTAQFLDVPPLSFAEVDSIEDTLYFQADNVQAEIQPATFREMTTSWSNEQEFRDSFQNTWDNFRQLDEESNSTEEFFEKLHTQYIGGGGSNGNFDMIKLFNAGGSFNFNIDLTWDEQSSGQRTEFEKFHEEVKNSGSVSEETLENIAEQWTGQRDIASVSPANLEIYRLSETELAQTLRFSMSVIEDLPSILDARTRLLDFNGSSTMISLSSFDGRLSALESAVQQHDGRIAASQSAANSAMTAANSAQSTADSANSAVVASRALIESAFEIRVGNTIRLGGEGSGEDRSGRSTATCRQGYTAVAVACEASGGETFAVDERGSFIDGRTGQCNFEWTYDWGGEKNVHAEVLCVDNTLLR